MHNILKNAETKKFLKGQTFVTNSAIIIFQGKTLVKFEKSVKEKVFNSLDAIVLGKKSINILEDTFLFEINIQEYIIEN